MLQGAPATPACTVDLAQLVPGDVLLTTEATATSWAIRQVTRSLYSHAILYVGEGLIIDSSPKDGIAFGLLQLVKAERGASIDQDRLFATVPKAMRIHVFRHARLAGQALPLEDRLDLMHKLHSVLPDKWGRDYSLLESLAMATPLLGRVPGLKRAVLRTVGRLGADRDKRVPSDFCSELVANALADFGLPPLKSWPQGDIPSPQSFADPAVSHLVRVHAAEAMPDPARDHDTDALDAARQRQSLHVSVRLNRCRKSQQHALAALNEVNAVVADLGRRMQRDLDKLRGGP